MFSFLNSQKYVGYFQNFLNISHSPHIFIQVLVLINWHHSLGQQWWSCHWIIFDKYLKLWLLQWSWIPDESNNKNFWGMFFYREFWDKIQILMIYLDWFLNSFNLSLSSLVYAKKRLPQRYTRYGDRSRSSCNATNPTAPNSTFFLK